MCLSLPLFWFHYKKIAPHLIIRPNLLFKTVYFLFDYSSKQNFWIQSTLGMGLLNAFLTLGFAVILSSCS